VLDVPNEVLREMYETSRATTSDGRATGLLSVVTPDFASALYRLVKKEKPALVLEIGLAHGATALSIATALNENGHGRLVSIDPFQSSDWQGVGLMALKRSKLDHLHTFIEEPDYAALPRLLDEWGRAVDLAYIDGYHSYEYVLLDFFYVDRMLNLSGIVGFNDCDWAPVMPTLRFVERHRHYVPVDVGLAPVYGKRSDWAVTYYRAEARLFPASVRPSRLPPIARIMGRRREDRYFRKSDTWEPPHGWMPRDWTRRP
jgi:predicted O-methyltransferase YrrM